MLAPWSKFTSILLPAPPTPGNTSPGRWLIFALVLILTLYGTLYYSLTRHEDAHARIMEYHGCKNITTVARLDLTGFARCEDHRTMSHQERGLHSLNEIIGYNIDAIILAIFGAVFCLSIILYRCTIS